MHQTTPYPLAPTTHACRACGASLQQEAMGPERFLRSGQTLMLCHNCSLAYLTPDFTADALSRFYTTDYRRISLLDAAAVHDAAFFARTLYPQYGEARVAMCAHEIPLGARVLEIGSGFGGLLGALHRKRPDLKLYATEMDAQHRTLLLGGAPVTFLDEATLQPHAPYDVIVLLHVLEHLPDPVGSLRRYGALLGPRGRLLVEVPDIAADWGNWLYVQPAHLSYFSADSLRRTVQRAGLRARGLGPHPGGPAFAGTLWADLAVPDAAPGGEAPDLATPQEIAALRAHILRYRWNAKQALRQSLRRALIALLGLNIAGAIARRKHYRRAARWFR